MPYHVCGSQQDASDGLRAERAAGRAVAAAAVVAVAAVRPRDVQPRRLARTATSRPIRRDPDVFYSGTNATAAASSRKLNRRTGEPREVSPYPRMFSGEESAVIKERWQWTYPIVFSPVDPNVLYASSQHLWKTTNGGRRWDGDQPPTSRATIRRRWDRRAARSRAT